MRLEVTRKSELALRAVHDLASSGAARKGAALAEAVGTTPSFLGQALAPLIRARWIRSEPGPRGGYRLAAGAHDLSVLDLIEAIEGPTSTVRCVLSERDCADVEKGGPCALHGAWLSARSSLLRELAAQRVLDKPRPLQRPRRPR